jgi:hypothetical protein
MATCEQETSFAALELPREFEDLEGLLHTDMRAIVAMITQRAHERLILTRREHSDLQSSLWNSLTAAVNQALEPLSAENR